MSKAFILIALTVLPSAVIFSQNAKISLKNSQDSASYSFGLMQSQRLKPQLEKDYNMAAFIAGMEAGLKNDSTVIRMVDAQQIYARYVSNLNKKASEKNRLEGEQFLANNKKRKGVEVTATGLQYEVIKKGQGQTKPTPADKVKIHYHTTTISGDVFDSSVERGTPVVFGFEALFKGWQEGLQMMVVGDKMKFYVPAELAFGDRPVGAKIKPYSPLILELELLEIVSK